MLIPARRPLPSHPIPHHRPGHKATPTTTTTTSTQVQTVQQLPRRARPPPPRGHHPAVPTSTFLFPSHTNPQPPIPSRPSPAPLPRHRAVPRRSRPPVAGGGCSDRVPSSSLCQGCSPHHQTTPPHTRPTMALLCVCERVPCARPFVSPVHDHPPIDCTLPRLYRLFPSHPCPPVRPCCALCGL